MHLHPWQVTAWLNRERFTLEQGAGCFGVSVATLLKWRDTCETFSPKQTASIVAVMGEVPELPARQPALWCNPYPDKGKPGVLTAKQVGERRKKLGLSVRELAKNMGLCPGYLYDIESGRRRCTERVATVLATLERKRA